MRTRAEQLRPHGWQPGRTLHIPSWCGCTTEYVPVPVRAGWWQLVPIWEPDQVANPVTPLTGRVSAAQSRSQGRRSHQSVPSRGKADG